MEEDARFEVIINYLFFGEGLEKRLVQYNHLEEHEARKKINIEVKDQLPKEVSKAAVRKKIERARKIYDLFFRITDDKNQRIEYIKRIKTFTASSISKLSSENIEYVASQVRMNTNDFKWTSQMNIANELNVVSEVVCSQLFYLLI